MNGLELNKIAAAIFIAGIIAMVSGFVSRAFYGPDDAKTRGFWVEVPEEGAMAAKEEEIIDLGTLMAAADIASGEKLAKKCVACHSFEKGGANKVGPNLWGVLSDVFAHKKDFAYSKAFEARKGEAWNYEKMYAFLENPRKYVEGTKMAFAGLKKPEQRAALMAYINSMADKKRPFPAPVVNAASVDPEAAAAIATQ